MDVAVAAGIPVNTLAPKISFFFAAHNDLFEEVEFRAQTVLERLQAMPHLSTIPVIVLSAQDAAQMSERSVAAGADRFIAKPFETEQLLEAIEAALRA